MKQANYTVRNSLPGDLAVWDGHVATVVGKLLMGYPHKAAGSNPAGGTSVKSQVRDHFLAFGGTGSCDLRAIFCSICQHSPAHSRCRPGAQRRHELPGHQDTSHN
jgi:hypothetical protein